MAKQIRKTTPKLSAGSGAERELKKLDTRTARLVAGVGTKLKAAKPKTLLNVYIGGMDTLSWTQNCHSGLFCSDEVWVDTETTLFLYKDKNCTKSAGLVTIYNGGRVRDNSSLLSTATTAYLANAPVSLHYSDSNEPYARGHGRLRAVFRL